MDVKCLGDLSRRSSGYIHHVRHKSEAVNDAANNELKISTHMQLKRDKRS